MQLDAQEFLFLAEQCRRICFFDIEATGLRGDYNSVLVVSVKPYHETPVSFVVQQPGNDKKVVREAKEYLESFTAWCGYYSKGFDIPMLNTRLLKWGYMPIEKRHHIDMYYTLKHKLITARKSQGHLVSWLDSSDERLEQKMTVSADVWNAIIYDTKENMPKMKARCESDATSLENLYDRTKHLIQDIKRT